MGKGEPLGQPEEKENYAECVVKTTRDFPS